MKKKSLKGMTLVEVLVAMTVFTIAFFGILFMNKHSSLNSENALINLCIIQYSKSLLEVLQSYPYNEPSYVSAGNPPRTPPGVVFNPHSITFESFDDEKSGVYQSDTDSTPMIRSGKPFTLTEEGISIRYNPTTLPASSTPKRRFGSMATLAPTPSGITAVNPLLLRVGS